jgi:peptidoglycan/xylan/chitin deacetylase (PgdA/CDA1 family)
MAARKLPAGSSLEQHRLIMIGVAASPAEFDAVREFFELFKTPWEFYREGQTYDVLLCSGECVHHGPATLVIYYAGRKIAFDGEQKVKTISGQPHSRTLSYKTSLVPIYGDAVLFANKDGALLTETISLECAGYLNRADKTARIGYGLFQEVQTLLTKGQPAGNAAMPALELHIRILRNLITGCGIPLVEVPPVPDGYSFIACLTHDVDNPSIRQHRWDHTTFGFLYRALLGSVLNLVRGKISRKMFLRNWSAALKLPFVHLGFIEDFWRRFAQAYRELEHGLPSTFFVIPFSNRPGKISQGQAPGFRAARYGAADIADIIQELVASGCEVGLHGIDAWFDSSDALHELEEVQRLTGTRQTGVRMHWLYFDQHSPVTLEQAGAAYDSTIGYNNTVGYRAGTTQAYKPFAATELLELPLHAMDTALFYPAYLSLSQASAATLLRQLIDNAVEFGGCFTINWHDRSVAPERNWDASYRFLLQELKARGAWFATAGQAVAWFKRRRSVRFETDAADPAAVCATVSIPEDANTPGLQLRVHNAKRPGATAAQASRDYVDLAFHAAGVRIKGISGHESSLVRA